MASFPANLQPMLNHALLKLAPFVLRTEARRTRFQCARSGWQVIEDGKHPARGYRAGYRLAGSEVVFTIDTRVCVVWGAHFLRTASGRRLSGSFNHGSMANA